MNFRVDFLWNKGKGSTHNESGGFGSGSSRQFHRYMYVGILCTLLVVEKIGLELRPREVCYLMSSITRVPWYQGVYGKLQSFIPSSNRRKTSGFYQGINYESRC